MRDKHVRHIVGWRRRILQGGLQVGVTHATGTVDCSVHRDHGDGHHRRCSRVFHARVPTNTNENTTLYIQGVGGVCMYGVAGH